MTRAGFQYEGPELLCDGVSLRDMARTHGTPLYVYSQATLLDRVRRLKAALADAPCTIHYAVKSCSNLSVLALMAREGCGADIVSGGELARALRAGFDPAKIVFSGVGKTRGEIVAALKAGVGAFNVESVAELAAIGAEAEAQRLNARVSFRVNPDVDAKTHPYISTGLKKNKFGLSKEELKEALALLPRLQRVEPVGLSCHIGSQILSLKPLEESWREVLAMAKKLPFRVKTLDLGGGLGIAYGKERAVSLEAYGKALSRFAAKAPGVKLGIEPGRCLSAEAGALLASVIAVKKRGKKQFVVLDAGMNDLLRPALYSARHALLPVKKGAASLRATLVGPVCESADTFEVDARVPALKEGDLAILTNAGAYGMSMASRYNSRPCPAEVLVADGKPRLIRARETLEDLMSHELDPRKGEPL